MTVYEPPATDAQPLTVRALLDDPALEMKVRLVAGSSGLSREINHPRIQKSGLALVGHLHGIHPNRVQVLGETELSYLETLDLETQAIAAAQLFSASMACVLVTRGVDPPRAFCEEAERTGTPLVVCAERTSSAITALHTLLDERLAPRSRIHGVLVDVFEVGVLLLGQSGIGKSECALELVLRGHRLVADDVIECDYRPPGMIFGQSAALLRHHIEVRGLGILNIKDLYGVTAIRERKRIDLIVRLELEKGDGAFDRIGLDDHHREILAVPIREVSLPVRPGRNMSSIIEIAARNELLRHAGHHAARDFVQRIESGLIHGAEAPPKRPPSGQFRRVTPSESAVPPPVQPPEPEPNRRPSSHYRAVRPPESTVPTPPSSGPERRR
jgi:HPr kinase/phosphorylase